MVYPACSVASLGLAWMLIGCVASGLRAQEGAAANAEAPLEDPLANSPAAGALRSIHRFEKAFLARACKLSEDQQRAVDQLDDSWKEAIPKQDNAADGQLLRALRGGVVIIQEGQIAKAMRGQARVNVVDDALHKYRDSLRTKFSEVLEPAQRDNYQQELKARDEFKRQVEAEGLVAILNNALGLQSEQRQGLIQALAQWPDKENIYISYYMENEGVLPVIPESLLSKHLDPKQMSIYRRARKSDARVGTGSFDAQQDPFGE